MKAKNREWKVTEHSPIEKIEDNLWVVEGRLPGTPIMRRMSMVKRSDGKILFYHAIPLEDSLLDEIRAWGTPAYLVVGHNNHMVDAHAFREKLGLKLYGPVECAKEISARTTLDGTFEEIPGDLNVIVKSVPGTKFGEPVAIVTSGEGARVSLLFCDAIQNNEKSHMPLVFRMIGFASEHPKVVPLFRLLFVKNKIALKQALLQYAETKNLSRIIPFHGAIAETNPAEALRSAANKL